MSHVPTYNFCYLCKERLDTYHDDQDEGWYFVNTKQIRINKDQSSEEAKGGRDDDDKQVVNVHTTCLKEIDLNSKQEKALGLKSSAVRPQQVAVDLSANADAGLANMKMDSEDVPLAGQRRTHIEYQQETQDAFSSLQGFISGMESQKTKRQCTTSGGFMWSQSQ